MNAADLERLLCLSRHKTLELLDAIAATADPAAVLGWRPGLDRAHIAWQLMHIAATEDRHLNIRMLGTEASAPDLLERFAGGSTPDDEIPPLHLVRTYLEGQRQALVNHLQTLSDADLERKPNEQAQWIYRDWFEVLAWHEAHHHGQAHITYNLYRAAHAAALPPVGH